MTRRTRRTSLLVVALLATLACDRRAEPPRDAATAAPAAAPTPAAGTPAAATGTPPTVTLRSRSVAGQGAILTDARGRALYLLEGDGAGINGCTATCTVIWPPFLAGAGAVAPAAGDTLVRASLIGTRARENGGVQITYGGHALYYYLGDRDSTDVLGHHVEDSWGEWALISPGGRPLPGGRRGGRDGDSDGRGRAGRRGG